MMNNLDDQVRQLVQCVNKNAEITILSYGMGVESTAVLLRMIFEPEIRPCSLDKLIVITSQTGDEWPDTEILVDQYIIPLLREYQIRFVQVGRHGHKEVDGFTVFEDSRNPTRCYIEGDYKLSKELLDAGTVPNFGGVHKCALKFKNTVIEQWLDQEVREPARHMFGYNINEQNRVKKSEVGFQERLKERMIFGFNREEMSRVNKAKKYDSAYRVGVYPLVEWGWNRSDCLSYIKQKLGVIWKKSACVYCPFAHNRQNLEELVSRQFLFPSQVADAMLMEHVSLSMNLRSPLYSYGSLYDMIINTQNINALKNYQKKLQSQSWGTYRVRRLFNQANMATRCVEKTQVVQTLDEAESLLLQNLHGELIEKWGIKYDFIQQKLDTSNREEFWVAAPALVETKARYGVDKFEKTWNHQDIEQLSLDLSDIA